MNISNAINTVSVSGSFSSSAKTSEKKTSGKLPEKVHRGSNSQVYLRNIVKRCLIM